MLQTTAARLIAVLIVVGVLIGAGLLVVKVVIAPRYITPSSQVTRSSA